MAKQGPTSVGVIVALLLAARSYGQLPFDETALNRAMTSDETVRAEVARIEKLPVPEPELLTDEIREAQAYARHYHQVQGYKPRLSETEIATAEAAARAASQKLLSAVEPCKADDVADAALAFSNARDKLIDVSAFNFFQQQRDMLTPAEQRAMPTITSVLSDDDANATQICGRLKTQDSRKRFATAVNDLITLARKANTFQSNEYTALGRHAKTLEEAWLNREAQLTPILRSKRVGADKLLNELPWYIGIFCVFGLALIAMVRLFEVDVQMEWVASGQVIQFATVMVLLIVIAALAIAKILSENTLGTLLGGVAGYVLSQGVGRAVARAAERAAERAADSRTGIQTPKSVRDRVFRLLRSHVSTTVRGSTTLSLSGDAAKRVTKELNRMISQAGGEPLDEGTVSSAPTAEDLVQLVESAIR